MPGNYAHYRFGKDMIRQLPPQMQRSIGRFRQLYDMGLHGPDLFYYGDPLCIRTNGKLGALIHSLSGRRFFVHARRGAKLHASEGMTAYLCGLLAHYTLDATCHAYIERNATSQLSYRQIEAEFDRYLLELDGKKSPHQYDCSRHMALTAGEAEMVAALYPGVTAAQVLKCTKNMAKCTHAMALPEGPRRELKLAVLSMVAPETAHRAVGLRPKNACAELNPSLLRLYQIASERYPLRLEALFAFLRKKQPLGPDFDAIFGK